MLDSVDLSVLRSVFWDVDFEALSWTDHQDFIIRRVLMRGNLKMIRWLRDTLGDPALAAWILARQGRGLSARQLRYWQVILDLPDSQVDQWVKATQ